MTHMREAAIRAAQRFGYTKMTRAQIAAEAGVSEGLVSHKFGPMDKLRRSVMEHAVDICDLAVIGQGIAAADPRALAAPPDVRRRAIKYLADLA